MEILAYLALALVGLCALVWAAAMAYAKWLGPYHALAASRYTVRANPRFMRHRPGR